MGGRAKGGAARSVLAVTEHGSTSEREEIGVTQVDNAAVQVGDYGPGVA